MISHGYGMRRQRRLLRVSWLQDRPTTPSGSKNRKVAVKTIGVTPLIDCES